ncbi:hypothetical protein VT84_09535 [Gemmata sp. SH-PL17]|uniref:hypothetical protein n=1 Tax=Gemmata sp. SH-PL17 TaxID=1630693 RepID=UPI00078DAC57|nr:hypothetical protein [Gemmata sp. SH-PL17]AMV24626.1 hypothetical protein VT84_09535 [Gemmata sp. SH-PL17]
MADLSNVPEAIQAALADVQAEFDAYQTATGKVTESLAALALAQSSVNTALSTQIESKSAVEGALTKLTDDIAATYSPPQGVGVPPAADAPMGERAIGDGKILALIAQYGPQFVAFLVKLGVIKLPAGASLPSAA